MYDVAVLGGGNAALCAALAAAERGARVIVIERAPRVFRGGNSRHVRNVRCMHTAPTGVLTDAYSTKTSSWRISCASPAAPPTKRWRA